MNDTLDEILVALNDNRSKLSALFSLYNNSLLLAEENRAQLGTYYEQMIDFKNDLNSISNEIASAKKSERANTLTAHKMKIKRLDRDAESVSKEFNSSCQNYKLALQNCGSLKAEYKHEVSELCKKFKAQVTDDTPAITLKGYKQQVKIIRAILDKIELLISDYNVKKNKMEEDSVSFNDLYDSVSTMLEQLQTIA